MLQYFLILLKEGEKMFFAKIGEFEPCGLFSMGHLILFFLTVVIIAVALIATRHEDKTEVKKIIQVLIVSIWVLEFFRIGYKLFCGDVMFLESYMPLFFCSIFLYSGLLSAFGKGKVQRAGDVVLSTGGLIGGVVFLIYPSTSLPDYPAFHFVSVHSFLYHGCMVYVGVLMLVSKYIQLKRSDIWLYAVSVFGLCVAALGVNSAFDCNLMFISKAFPGHIGQAVFSRAGVLYTPIMVLIHTFLPFYVVYGIYKLKNKTSVLN